MWPRCIPQSLEENSTWKYGQKTTFFATTFTSGSLYHDGLTLVPVRMNNYIHYKVWNQIFYLFPNVIGCTVKFATGVIIYPCSIKGTVWEAKVSLHWRHNNHDGVSNHQPYGCLLNRLFRHRSKKTSKLLVTGLCVGNSPGTGEFPAQMASNAENVSIWWRHHE